MSSLGVALFSSSIVGIHVLRRTISSLKAVRDIPSKITDMERLIQRDEGGRGIHEISPPLGELYASAKLLLNSKNIVIMTGLASILNLPKPQVLSGFPCLLNYDPPTETDGPLGCMAIARCCLRLGKKVTIITDEVNEEVVLAAAAAAQLSSFANPSDSITLESFPPTDSCTESDFNRLDDIREEADLIIAIERTGPSASGRYLTMRGKDMTHIVAPLDLLFQPPHEEFDASISKPNRPLKSIGIGDGGNEVGMGMVYEKILASQIPKADEIACIVDSTCLIVASVSNWGGYALAAATALLATENPNFTKEFASECLPSDSEETLICERMVLVGARDGVTGKQELSVDGMPLSTSLAVINQLKDLIIE